MLDGADYDEIILETPPSHVSHWLHVDLPERVRHLGVPIEGRDGHPLRSFHVTFTSEAEPVPRILEETA